MISLNKLSYVGRMRADAAQAILDDASRRVFALDLATPRGRLLAVPVLVVAQLELERIGSRILGGAR